MSFPTNIQKELAGVVLSNDPPRGTTPKTWAIFRQHIRGASYDQLALQYSVSRQNIYQIVTRIAKIAKGVKRE